MLAATYEAFRSPLSVQTVADPAPSPTGAVIRVGATGLCRSDWHGWMGHDDSITTLPHVPGHELAGEVVAVGAEVRGDWTGQRVTLPFVCGCGHCGPCQGGQHQICDHQFQPGFTGWGSFAEYVAIEYADTNLVRLPEDMSFVTAAILGCRFPTAFHALAHQAEVRPGEWLAVYGCGGLGLSCIMIAHALGARVIGVDLIEDKLALARTLGAEITVNASLQKDPATAVKEATRGGAAVSVDALGDPATCHASVSSLRKRGRHVQVGLLAPGEHGPLVPMSAVIANELAIVGSHGMQAHHFGAMLGMITAKSLPIDQLLGHTLTLSEAADELPRMDQSSHPGVSVVNEFA